MSVLSRFTKYNQRFEANLCYPGRAGDGIALAAGFITPLGFAPFHLFFIPWFTLALLFWQLHAAATPRAAAWRGFVFGFGMFASGVSWVYVAMNVFGHLPVAVAVLLALVLASYMALFPAATAYVFKRFFKSERFYIFILVLPLAWVVMEGLRGWLFTGFPWLLAGYSQLPWVMSGWAPVLGVFGMSWLLCVVAVVIQRCALMSHWRKNLVFQKWLLPVAAVAALPATVWFVQLKFFLWNEVLHAVDRWLEMAVLKYIVLLPLWLLTYMFMIVVMAVAAVLLLGWLESLFKRQWAWLVVAVMAAGFGLGMVEWTEPAGKELRVSVLQGNVPQDKKWQRSQQRKTLALYRNLVQSRLGDDIIVLPENALTLFQHHIRPYLDALSRQASENRSALLIGVPILRGKQYYNSMVVRGNGSGVYDKSHLVPFGEYIPLKSTLGSLLKLMNVPMADFSAGQKNHTLLQAAGVPVAANICYEDAFVGELIGDLPKARLLVNASNNAWYGDSLAPHQHLQIAQARALEMGRYILRATTNGISAIIDHRGRILVRSPQFQQAAIHGKAQPRQGATPFVRFGYYLMMGICLGGLGLGFYLSRRR